MNNNTLIMTSVIPILASLVTEGNMAINWKKYKRNFQTFVMAYHSQASEESKVAMLLHSGGEDFQDVFDSLELSAAEKKVLTNVLEAFDGHYLPKTNVTYERFVFFTRKQKAGESFEQYMTVLQNLSVTCELGTLKDELLRDIFVTGITDAKLQEKLLNTPKLTKEMALEICRSRATVSDHIEQIQAPEVKQEPPEIDVIRRSKPRQSNMNPSGTITNCRFCSFNHAYGRCPAFGKPCNACGEKNHFKGSLTCSKTGNKRQPAIHEVSHEGSDNDTSDVEFWCDSIHFDNYKNMDLVEWYTAKLTINGQCVQMKIDSGAACNVMGLSQFVSLGFGKKNLRKTGIILKSFTNNKVPVLGRCDVSCNFKNKDYIIEFMIMDGDCPNLLGLKSSELMGLIARVDNLISKPKVPVPAEFSHLFNGKVGCFASAVKIYLEKNYVPVICPVRRIPQALMGRVKKELERMEKSGIIKKITKPTEWVNQMAVVAKKDGSLRICIDPRNLNKFIKRPHIPFPTVDEIAARVGNAKFFCKLDAQSGFWMLPLDEASSRLCTFQTLWGRYSFLRLPFGLNCSSEIFHAEISETFNDFNTVATYQDDILIWADTKEKLREVLRGVLARADAKGIKFNPNKCIFYANKVEFLGHSFSEKGISVTSEKIKAVTELKNPSDKKSLQRVLGMFNYLSKFIPNYSELTGPLRDLLKDDVVFLWTEAQDKSFEALKRAVTSAPVLAFFDARKNVTVSVDASSRGLGAALLQEGCPIAFASKALSETQQRYSQIEKELLAVCFGLIRFKHFVLGRDKVKVETDHKPLLGLVNKPLHKIPSRLQKMLLHIQPYCFYLVHTPGKYMYVADTLSRDFSPAGCDKVTRIEDNEELFIASLMGRSLISKQKSKLVDESRKDALLSQLRHYIKEGWPTYKNVVEGSRPFYEFRDELNLCEDLVLKGDRIIIPKSMQPEVLKLLHTGHMGIHRTISRAEDTVFWLGINQHIKKYIKSCLACLKFQDNKCKTLLKSKELPVNPWSEVACDTFEWNQHHYLVVVDSLTNFIEFASLPNLRSATVIQKIKAIFARHGIPLVLYTDGGLCFDSQLFRKFAEEWNFVHMMSSPHYPRSNGLAESAVKSMKKLLNKSFESGEDPMLGLLNLRTTPRVNTSSPASGLMGRNLRSNIPCSPNYLNPKITIDKDRQTLIANRMLSKASHDRTAKPRKPFCVGDVVMFQKLPNSIWTPGVIVSLASTPRSYIVKTKEGSSYKRNEIYICHRRLRDDEPLSLPAPPPIPIDSPQQETVKNIQLSPAARPNQSQSGEQISPDLITSEEVPAAPSRQPETTRSGRQIKIPNRFAEYQLELSPEK